MSSELEYQEISAEKAEELLLNLNRSANYQRLRETFKSKSLFEIASKERDERTHSSYIQWLLRDSDVPCDWRDSTIAHLLDIILFRAKEQGLDIDSDIKRSILSRSGKITLMSVEKEKPTSGVKVNGKSGFIDLLITCNVVCPKENKKENKSIEICIENKVGSDEHDDQTWKYWLYLKGPKGLEECKKSVKNVEFSKKYDRDFNSEGEQHSEDESNPKVEQLFVFLTPWSNLELQDKLENDDKKRKLCSCPHYIIINYQDIMDYILEPILKMPNLPEKTKFYIEEYINTLCIPYREEDNKNNNFPIMAIDDNTRALLSEFWQENQRLLLAAVNAFANDDKQDLDERKIAIKIRDEMKKITKKYKITKWEDGSEADDKPYGPSAVVFETIKHLLERGHKIDEINGNINKNRKNNKKVVITENEFATTKKNDKEWKKVEINNEKYRVYTQWESKPTGSRYVKKLFIDPVGEHYKIEITEI